MQVQLAKYSLQTPSDTHTLPQAAGAVPQAQQANQEAVMVINSCPGCSFTITRAVLQGKPRLELERIYTALLHTMQGLVLQHREVRCRASTSGRATSEQSQKHPIGFLAVF
jgi:hypothetical protein